jgi:hypothetical protein
MSERRNIGFENDDEQQERTKKPYGVGFNEKNYLDVKLKDTENQKEKKIRLLPFDGESTSAFKIIKMHNVRVPKEISASTWKSYVCLAQEDVDHEKYGDKCPFCELNHIYYEQMSEAKKALAETTDDAKKAELEADIKRYRDLSLSYKSQEVCIVRCIERDAEEDGPKFWKFNVRSDGEDPMHKIKALQELRKQESIDVAKEENGGTVPEDFTPENILDLYEGKDLKITIKPVYDKEGKRTNKTSISIADYGKNKPVSTDDDLLDEWIDDEKKWYDVFTVKPYEYLELISEGEIPFFDKIHGKWISKIKKKDEDNSKREAVKAKNDEANTEIREASKKAMAIEEEEQSEDLPF